MSYRRLSKKALLFRSFTGLTVPEFDYIYEEIESKYEEYERTRRRHAFLKKGGGGGRGRR
jgi:hypothetical protein